MKHFRHSVKLKFGEKTLESTEHSHDFFRILSPASDILVRVQNMAIWQNHGKNTHFYLLQ